MDHVHVLYTNKLLNGSMYNWISEYGELNNIREMINSDKCYETNYRSMIEWFNAFIEANACWKYREGIP